MPVKLDQGELRALIENREKIRRENIDFYLEKQSQLQEDYGGRVIAIAGESVVDHEDNVDDLDVLRTFIDRIQTEYEGAYITKVPEPNESMML